MILVIDVGNTNLVIGAYVQDELKHQWRINTSRSRTADEYAMLLLNLFSHAQMTAKQVEGVIISSVVPQLMHILSEMCEQYLGQDPLIVGPGIKTGLNIRYDHPKEVGADRIVNAVAAIHLYGSPLIIIDFGTATTFEYIDESGAYIGGAITPGIGISTEALFQHAAKLKRIEFDMVKPKNVIGTNSVSAVQSGILYGFSGQVDGIVNRIREEVNKETKVVATGGLASFIATKAKTIDIVNKELTLYGLKLIYEMNRRDTHSE